jgi:hypothetical protein
MIISLPSGGTDRLCIARAMIQARFRSARALPFGAAVGQLRWLGKISLAGFASDNQAL